MQISDPHIEKYNVYLRLGRILREQIVIKLLGAYFSFKNLYKGKGRSVFLIAVHVAL